MSKSCFEHNSLVPGWIFFFNFNVQLESRLSLFFWRAPSETAHQQRTTFFLFFSSRGPLLDWSRQIMLYSHWSTKTECSTHSCSKQPLMKLCGSLYTCAIGFSTLYKWSLVNDGQQAQYDGHQEDEAKRVIFPERFLLKEGEDLDSTTQHNDCCSADMNEGWSNSGEG